MINKICLSEKEQTLIKLYIEGNYSVELLDYLLSDIDIETTNFYYLLTLAQYANRCDPYPKNANEQNNKKLKRINGVLKQTRLRNTICMRVFDDFLSKINESTDEGKVCALKDLPMRLLYDNNTTRVLYEMPVVVSPDVYKKAVKIADNTNSKSKYPFSKIIVKKSYNDIDINTLTEKELALNNQLLYLPSPENTLIILLNFYIDKLLTSTENHICFKGFYDGAKLIEICDKNTLMQNAKCQKNEELIKFWLFKIEKYFNTN